tara:strand:+ start:493 stop:777 length:285 start_codon:yes stop_codon:yes gene_type:complete
MTIEVSTLLASAIFTYIAFKVLFFVGVCVLYYMLFKTFMTDSKLKEELRMSDSKLNAVKEELQSYKDSDPHLTNGHPDFDPENYRNPVRDTRTT